MVRRLPFSLIALLVVIFLLAGCAPATSVGSTGGAATPELAVRGFIAADDRSTRLSLLAPEVASDWQVDRSITPPASTLSRVVTLTTTPVTADGHPWLADWNAVQELGTDFGSPTDRTLFWLVGQRREGGPWFVVGVGTGP